MPHYPKPYYRPNRQTWFVQIDGREHTLGRDKDAAWQKYHELMAARGQQPVVPPVADAKTVVVALERFMGHVEANRSPRTYEFYQRVLKSFRLSLPSQTLTLAELMPAHVTDWIAQHPDWSATTRHGSIHAVKKAIRWACKEWRLGESPLFDVEAPTPNRREVFITAEQWPQLLAACTDSEFHDLLSFLWETGSRPQEARNAEKRHLDAANRRLVFPKEESKGKKFSRVIYLNDAAFAIIQRLCEKWPEGKLFRMPDSRPWTRNAIRCRFRRQRIHRRVKMKIEGICCYAIRHSYATNALKAGVDPVTLAVLMGHADASMIANVYQHLATNPTFLLDAARQARHEGQARPIFRTLFSDGRRFSGEGR